MMFPSCRPPIQALLSVAGPMCPRLYSIATSPLSCPDRIAIAFSVVRYCLPAPGASLEDSSQSQGDENILRCGMATSYLEDTLQRWLNPDKSIIAEHDELPTIRIFHKPSISFRLPGSVTTPLILLGPGTGVSPFIGFLQHRAQLLKHRDVACTDECVGVWRGSFELDGNDLPTESTSTVDCFISSLNPGPVHLFHGCRDENDYLFQDSLERWLLDGILTSLEVAMSRKAQEKVYITHRLRDRGEEIAGLLLRDGASIYVCGDGNTMAKDVHVALKEILRAHGGLSEVEAEEYLQGMKSRRRYVLDIWS